MSAPYQLLPPLSGDEYAALRADIAEHGIRVPVDVDETGAILDGHHRVAIAGELDIPYPTRVVAGLTDEEKRHHAVAVNAHRRMLTRDQRRELVAAELARDPSRSDRAIGRITGVDHKTVGAMRRGGWGIPHPGPDRPTCTREEAEQITQDIVRRTEDLDLNMIRALGTAAMSPALLATHLRKARVQFRNEIAAELGEDYDIVDETMFCSRFDFLAAVQVVWRYGPTRDGKLHSYVLDASKADRRWLQNWAEFRPFQHQQRLAELREGAMDGAA